MEFGQLHHVEYYVAVLPEYLHIVNNRQASGLNHIAFKGESENFLNDLNVKLLSSGIRIQTKDDHHICFIDPNNFAVEVFI
jgi:catechol 2,3-dioxygenase-like lactoylglutathione lyase family enzyme